jgi:hypothetical protein
VRIPRQTPCFQGFRTVQCGTRVWGVWGLRTRKPGSRTRSGPGPDPVGPGYPTPTWVPDTRPTRSPVRVGTGPGRDRVLQRSGSQPDRDPTRSGPGSGCQVDRIGGRDSAPVRTRVPGSTWVGGCDPKPDPGRVRVESTRSGSGSGPGIMSEWCHEPDRVRPRSKHVLSIRST